METTILLSKVLGLFITISGVIIMLRREYYLPMMALFVKERMTRMILAFVELIASLFLLVTHYDFSTTPAAIITLIGLAAAIESVGYLLIPDRLLTKYIRAVNTPAVYVIGGLFAVLLGLYLVNYGFALV